MRKRRSTSMMIKIIYLQEISDGHLYIFLNLPLERYIILISNILNVV